MQRPRSSQPGTSGAEAQTAPEPEPEVTIQTECTPQGTLVRVLAPSRQIRLLELMPLFEDLGLSIVSYANERAPDQLAGQQGVNKGQPRQSFRGTFLIVDADGQNLDDETMQLLAKSLQQELHVRLSSESCLRPSCAPSLANSSVVVQPSGLLQPAPSDTSTPESIPGISFMPQPSGGLDRGTSSASRPAPAAPGLSSSPQLTLTGQLRPPSTASESQTMFVDVGPGDSPANLSIRTASIATAMSGASDVLHPQQPADPATGERKNVPIAASAAHSVASLANALHNQLQIAASLASSLQPASSAQPSTGAPCSTTGGDSALSSPQQSTGGSPGLWWGSINATDSIAAIMSTPVVRISADADLAAAKSLMTRHHISALMVDTGTDSPGFLTKRDFLKVSFSHDLKRKRVRDVMTQPVVCVEATDSIISCSQLLEHHGVRRVLVHDSSIASPSDPMAAYVGIVSDTDLFRCLGNPEQWSATGMRTPQQASAGGADAFTGNMRASADHGLGLQQTGAQPGSPFKSLQPTTSVASPQRRQQQQQQQQQPQTSPPAAADGKASAAPDVAASLTGPVHSLPEPADSQLDSFSGDISAMTPMPSRATTQASASVRSTDLDVNTQPGSRATTASGMGQGSQGPSITGMAGAAPSSSDQPPSVHFADRPVVLDSGVNASASQSGADGASGITSGRTSSHGMAPGLMTTSASQTTASSPAASMSPASSLPSSAPQSSLPQVSVGTTAALDDGSAVPTSTGTTSQSTPLAGGNDLPAAGSGVSSGMLAASAALSLSSEPSFADRYRAAAALWELDFTEIELLRKIGEGSFGEVMLGNFRGTKVAVKRLRAFESTENGAGDGDGVLASPMPPPPFSPTMGPIFKQFFEREIEILATIRHPNVVNFIGACHTPPNVCLVTEYCARGSLDHLLHKSGIQLDLVKKVEFALDIARGMSCLHAQRSPVIHRDLKTANLLVSARFEVKVSDFGLSRIKDHAQLVNSRAGLEGTVEYAAPEVLRGEPFTEKCDVHSFGVVLWELVHRQRPYADADVPIYLLMMTLANGTLRLPPVREESTGATPGLAKLVERCMAMQPADRPSFREVLHLLEHEYKIVRGKAAAVPRSDSASSMMVGTAVAQAAQAQGLYTPSPAAGAPTASGASSDTHHHIHHHHHYHPPPHHVPHAGHAPIHTHHHLPHAHVGHHGLHSAAHSILHNLPHHGHHVAGSGNNSGSSARKAVPPVQLPRPRSRRNSNSQGLAGPDAANSGGINSPAGLPPGLPPIMQYAQLGGTDTEGSERGTPRHMGGIPMHAHGHHRHVPSAPANNMQGPQPGAGPAAAGPNPAANALRSGATRTSGKRLASRSKSMPLPDHEQWFDELEDGTGEMDDDGTESGISGGGYAMFDVPEGYFQQQHAGLYGSGALNSDSGFGGHPHHDGAHHHHHHIMHTGGDEQPEESGSFTMQSGRQQQNGGTPGPHRPHPPPIRPGPGAGAQRMVAFALGSTTATDSGMTSSYAGSTGSAGSSQASDDGGTPAAAAAAQPAGHGHGHGHPHHGHRQAAAAAAAAAAHQQQHHPSRLSHMLANEAAEGAGVTSSPGEGPTDASGTSTPQHPRHDGHRSGLGHHHHHHHHHAHAHPHHAYTYDVGAAAGHELASLDSPAGDAPRAPDYVHVHSVQAASPFATAAATPFAAASASPFAAYSQQHQTGSSPVSQAAGSPAAAAAGTPAAAAAGYEGATAPPTAAAMRANFSPFASFTAQHSTDDIATPEATAPAAVPASRPAPPNRADWAPSPFAAAAMQVERQDSGSSSHSASSSSGGAGGSSRSRSRGGPSSYSTSGVTAMPSFTEAIQARLSQQQAPGAAAGPQSVGSSDVQVTVLGGASNAVLNSTAAAPKTARFAVMSPFASVEVQSFGGYAEPQVSADEDSNTDTVNDGKANASRRASQAGGSLAGSRRGSMALQALTMGSGLTMTTTATDDSEVDADGGSLTLAVEIVPVPEMPGRAHSMTAPRVVSRPASVHQNLAGMGRGGDGADDDDSDMDMEDDPGSSSALHTTAWLRL